MYFYKLNINAISLIGSKNKNYLQKSDVFIENYFVLVNVVLFSYLINILCEL